MRRRDLIVGGLLAVSFARRASAQPRNRVRQLLLIGNSWSDQVTSDPASPRWAVFLKELRRHGYEAGVNLVVSWREGVEDWGGPRDEWTEVMDDIRRLAPDVIVTTSHGWARLLNSVIGTIPIVVSALSPIEQGVISSLTRASGSITGIAIDLGPDFYNKELDLLLEAAPMISYVGLLSAERTYGGMRQLWREAKQRGVGIQEFPYSSDYEARFDSMVREGATAVLVLADANHVPHANRIARLARRHRLPLMSPFRRMTEAGALMSYGIDWNAVDRGLAVYTARVLGGAKPSELPFEQPSRYELVLNLQTADDLGLTFPDSLRAFADDMLERGRSP
ncbi:ABC transporter substrate-binding protein [Microvirga zambiensis]|uniref:ABC transporter substrate-binding protein n=1 Tax=Microvirga zambiensis TaxID=1402137 RepID=UPI001FEC420B|nr:ABC transporter substrate-binding protein [Microvirga zambiensis]